MVGTQSERIIAAKHAVETEKATRRRPPETTRWRDQHGNLRNINTINSKSKSEPSTIDRSRGNGQKRGKTR